tara:strand:- start:1375 stop:2346 length:972 start_codon:yes stop_codon:yes gene_type:complete
MAVYTRLEKKDIDTILEDYSIGNLEKFDPIEEGVENTNYKIVVNKKKYILTIYEKRVDEKDLPFFCSLTTELFKKNFKCPLPIKNKNNEMISGFRDKKLTILSFIEGESKKSLSENDSYKVGLETSRLHILTNNIDLYRKNSLSVDSWVKIYNEIKLVHKNTEDTKLKFIEDSLNQIKKDWPRNLPTGIIHGDIFIDNIIFLGENINGIIDYTFACNEFFAFDIAICLNALCFDQVGDEYNFNILNARNFLKGYIKNRSLEESEKQNMKVLCQGAALRFLLTRFIDSITQNDFAFVKIKDPTEYIKKLEYFNSDKNLESKIFE